MFFLGLADPLPIEPVVRVVGVAVEPQPRPRHTAPCQCLLHKGTGHQCHFVQKYPAERHALNQCRRTFVPAAKEIEPVRPAGKRNVHIIPAHPFQTGEPQTAQQFQQRCHDISLQGRDRLAAQGKAAVLETGHRPADKADRHGESFSRTNSTVTDNGIIVAVGLAAPPRHGEFLLGRKVLNLLHRCPPPLCRKVPSA